MTLHEAIVAAADDTRVEFVSAARPFVTTRDELVARAARVAGGLAARGVGPGDAVAVKLPNGPEWAALLPAVLMRGATIVPIIGIYGAKETDFIVAEAGAKLLLDDLDAVAEGEPVAPLAGTVDDIAVLTYTSGTSANPKGVQHTHRSVLAELDSQLAFYGAVDSVRLAAFPFGHIAGLIEVCRMFLWDGPTFVMDAWDAGVAAHLIAEHGVTTTAGTPFHLTSLLDAAEAQSLDLSSVSQYVTGAATVPASLAARADASGVTVMRVYGLSEQPTVTSSHMTDSIEKRTQTDGRPMPGNEVRILLDDDTEAGTGVDGEIVLRGREQFAGYRDPALMEGLYVDGWMRTGDVGHLDADGFLTITDRKKDIIVRGGENISSREVEEAMLAHPAVADVAAVAMADERYGERVCVYVVLRDGATLDLDDLRAHFSALGLARQKTPERIEVVSEFPRTPAGKVKKAELRTRLRAVATPAAPRS